MAARNKLVRYDAKEGIFVSVTKKDWWDDMFEVLKQFKNDHGDCLVPSKWEDNQKLAYWVSDQRRQKREKNKNKQSALTYEREERLNKIGFVWDVHQYKWENKYEQYNQFVKNHGSCSVTEIWQENLELAEWANQQRKQRKRGRLTDERERKLNEIGFIWSMYEKQM
mmetsp:Transcript_19542/g.29274  ORF Transcript_19542/g.29274 Transcript_19542/m.29274 type:complete len:167 (+) Transcript_19542:163-663(+)